MDDARTRIIGGVAALLIAAALAPKIVGTLLMLFSVLVLIFAIVGAVWPTVLKLPNRLASVWVFTLSVGMFIGGGMLISPPNGNGTASDSPAETPSDTAPSRSSLPISEGANVTQSTWTNGPWPFTEDAGRVVCTRMSGAPAIFFVTNDRRRWPLNGVAKSNADQFSAEPTVDPIWLENPDLPGTRISITPMISLGRDTCQRLEQRRSAAARRRTQAARPVDHADIIILCHNYVQARVLMSGAGVDLDFPAFMDGARGAQHLGGTEYAFESYVDLVDGRESTRLHYHCRVENGSVIAFMER